jgi:hypothetical protein
MLRPGTGITGTPTEETAPFTARRMSFPGVYLSQLIRNATSTFNSGIASSTDSSTAVDDEVRQLYEWYQAAESDAERREIALEIGELDGRRHAEMYAALEDE